MVLGLFARLTEPSVRGGEWLKTAHKKARGRWIQRAGDECFSFPFCEWGLLIEEAVAAQKIGEGFEFGIPLGTETADERFAQETIDGQAKFAAFGHGGGTDGPTVVVERDGAVGEGLLANGIEGATDGFRPVDAAFAKRAIGGAKTKSVFVVACETTFAAADDAGDEVAVAVAIGHSLFVEHFARTGTELHAHGGEHALEFATLLGRDGSAGFAFDAAGAATGGEIATKMFGENIGRQEHVAYLENGEHGEHRARREGENKERRKIAARRTVPVFTLANNGLPADGRFAACGEVGIGLREGTRTEEAAVG